MAELIIHHKQAIENKGTPSTPGVADRSRGGGVGPGAGWTSLVKPYIRTEPHCLEMSIVCMSMLGVCSSTFEWQCLCRWCRLICADDSKSKSKAS